MDEGTPARHETQAADHSPSNANAQGVVGAVQSDVELKSTAPALADRGSTSLEATSRDAHDGAAQPASSLPVAPRDPVGPSADAVAAEHVSVGGQHGQKVQAEAAREDTPAADDGAHRRDGVALEADAASAAPSNGDPVVPSTAAGADPSTSSEAGQTRFGTSEGAESATGGAQRAAGDAAALVSGSEGVVPAPSHASETSRDAGSSKPPGSGSGVDVVAAPGQESASAPQAVEEGGNTPAVVVEEEGVGSANTNPSATANAVTTEASSKAAPSETRDKPVDTGAPPAAVDGAEPVAHGKGESASANEVEDAGATSEESAPIATGGTTAATAEAGPPADDLIPAPSGAVASQANADAADAPPASGPDEQGDAAAERRSPGAESTRSAPSRPHEDTAGREAAPPLEPAARPAEDEADAGVKSKVESETEGKAAGTAGGKVEIRPDGKSEEKSNTQGEVQSSSKAESKSDGKSGAASAEVHAPSIHASTTIPTSAPVADVSSAPSTPVALGSIDDPLNAQRIALVFKINEELIRLCVQLQEAKQTGDALYRQAAIRLQSNLGFLAGMADRSAKPLEVVRAAQPLLPRAEPLPTSEAVTDSRLPELYAQLAATLQGKSVPLEVLERLTRKRARESVSGEDAEHRKRALVEQQKPNGAAPVPTHLVAHPSPPVAPQSAALPSAGTPTSQGLAIAPVVPSNGPMVPPPSANLGSVGPPMGHPVTAAPTASPVTAAALPQSLPSSGPNAQQTQALLQVYGPNAINNLQSLQAHYRGKPQPMITYMENHIPNFGNMTLQQQLQSMTQLQNMAVQRQRQAQLLAAQQNQSAHARRDSRAGTGSPALGSAYRGAPAAMASPARMLGGVDASADSATSSPLSQNAPNPLGAAPPSGGGGGTEGISAAGSPGISFFGFAGGPPGMGLPAGVPPTSMAAAGATTPAASAASASPGGPAVVMGGGGGGGAAGPGLRPPGTPAGASPASSSTTMEAGMHEYVQFMQQQQQQQQQPQQQPQPSPHPLFPSSGVPSQQSAAMYAPQSQAYGNVNVVAAGFTAGGVGGNGNGNGNGVNAVTKLGPDVADGAPPPPPPPSQQQHHPNQPYFAAPGLGGTTPWGVAGTHGGQP